MICAVVFPMSILPNSYRIGSCVKMRSIGVESAMHQGEKDDQENILLRDLIGRCQEGDAEALEAMYEKYKKPFFSLIYRHTNNLEVSEDLLQDCFLKIFRNLQYIKSEATFNGWAYRIVINTCYSYLRSKKTQAQRTIPLDMVERTFKAKDQDTQENVVRKPLDEAIRSLPKKLKSVFLLHDVQGFRHHEIARILGCSVGTSKSQLFKARMRLREYLRNKQVL